MSDDAARHPKPRRTRVIVGLVAAGAVVGAVLQLRQPPEPATAATAGDPPAIAVHPRPGPSTGSGAEVAPGQARIDHTRWSAAVLGLGVRGVRITIRAGASQAEARVLGLGTPAAPDDSADTRQCIDLVSSNTSNGGPDEPAISVTVTHDGTATATVDIHWPDGRVQTITERLATCSSDPAGSRPSTSVTPAPPQTSRAPSGGMRPAAVVRPRAG